METQEKKEHTIRMPINRYRALMRREAQLLRAQILVKEAYRVLAQIKKEKEPSKQ